MIFNNSKKQMYFILKDFNKTKDFKKTIENTKNKFKIYDNKLGFRINECVNRNLLDGINTSHSINNSQHSVLCEHIFITYNGYEFITNYHSKAKSIIRDILLIVITAVITSLVNNYLSKSDQYYDIISQIINQENK